MNLQPFIAKRLFSKCELIMVVTGWKLRFFQHENEVRNGYLIDTFFSWVMFVIFRYVTGSRETNYQEPEPNKCHSTTCLWYNQSPCMVLANFFIIARIDIKYAIDMHSFCNGFTFFCCRDMFYQIIGDEITNRCPNVICGMIWPRLTLRHSPRHVYVSML